MATNITDLLMKVRSFKVAREGSATAVKVLAIILSAR
jgi:hypothetical protein